MGCSESKLDEVDWIKDFNFDANDTQIIGR